MVPDWMLLPDWAVTVVLVALVGGVLIANLVLASTLLRGWVSRNALGGYAPPAKDEVLTDEEEQVVEHVDALAEQQRADEAADVDPLTCWSYPADPDAVPVLFLETVIYREVSAWQADGPTGQFPKDWIAKALERAR